MMKIFAVWLCVFCSFSPAVAQIDDECAEGGCREEEMHFDLMHVKQTLRISTIASNARPARDKVDFIPGPVVDICTEPIDGELLNSCQTCVLTNDPWCGENDWDLLCHQVCCGETVYATNGCEAACSGTAVCDSPTPVPPLVHIEEQSIGCVDGDWHEVGDASHDCAWVGEDPSYRCSDAADVNGLKAWQVCTQSCGLCDECADGDWHVVGEESHNCAWVGEDPSYRCSETANAVSAWQVCRVSCGICDPPVPCADGDWHEVGEESHDCAWAGEDPSYRCSGTANADGLEAYEVCKQSCGLCECADGDWHEAGEESHDCAWAGEDPSYRCSGTANVDGLKAWQVCTLSCGLCECVDDPAWHEASDPSHDCAWVIQTMTIDPNTCDSAMGGGVSPVSAWKGCPLACGACPEPPEEPSVLNDPHMTSLGGDKFDINQPADYVLLRAPLELAQSALFELRATMEADEVSPCGLYVKAVTLSGTWFGDAIVHVRPLKRNKAGSNTAGTTTEWPFSMQVSSQDPWKSFSDFSAGNGTKALTEMVKIVAARREEFGGLLEGQAFTFRVGTTGRPAKIVVSQAAHQALNVELMNIQALGQGPLGGLLGTEKHSKDVEKLTAACKAYKGKQAMEKGKSALLRVKQMADSSWLTASWS